MFGIYFIHSRYWSSPLLLKKLVFWLLVGSLSSVQALQAKDLPDTVRFVDSERMWPFVFQDNDGRKLGVMPESIRKVFSGLGIDTQISLAPDARTLTEVLNGHADATTVFLFNNLTIDDYPA